MYIYIHAVHMWRPDRLSVYSLLLSTNTATVQGLLTCLHHELVYLHWNVYASFEQACPRRFAGTARLGGREVGSLVTELLLDSIQLLCELCKQLHGLFVYHSFDGLREERGVVVWRLIT